MLKPSVGGVHDPVGSVPNFHDPTYPQSFRGVVGEGEGGKAVWETTVSDVMKADRERAGPAIAAEEDESSGNGREDGYGSNQDHPLVSHGQR
jgi:hypothetical protein